MSAFGYYPPSQVYIPTTSAISPIATASHLESLSADTKTQLQPIQPNITSYTRTLSSTITYYGKSGVGSNEFIKEIIFVILSFLRDANPNWQSLSFTLGGRLTALELEDFWKILNPKNQTVDALREQLITRDLKDWNKEVIDQLMEDNAWITSIKQIANKEPVTQGYYDPPAPVQITMAAEVPLHQVYLAALVGSTSESKGSITDNSNYSDILTIQRQPSKVLSNQIKRQVSKVSAASSSLSIVRSTVLPIPAIVRQTSDASSSSQTIVRSTVLPHTQTITRQASKTTDSSGYQSTIPNPSFHFTPPPSNVVLPETNTTDVQMTKEETLNRLADGFLNI